MEKVRDVEVVWRLFSLELVNAGEQGSLAELHAKGTAPLRTLVRVRDEHGNDAVGALYQALGEHVHEAGEDLSPALVKAALAEIGLVGSLLDEALADETTMRRLQTEHAEVVEGIGAFGVPTIVLPSGNGIFGPVISTPPTGEDAGRLWDHVAWLIEADGFFELKRRRDRGPGE